MREGRGRVGTVLVWIGLVVVLPAWATEVVRIDGDEDFVPIAKNGFAFVTDGDFFGGDGYPNLVPGELGSPRNSYAWSMAWFDGRLYVGTTRDVLCFQGADPSACPIGEDGRIAPGEDQRAEIWRYTPSLTDFGLSGSWERVYQSPPVGFPLSYFTPELPRDIGYRGMTVCDAGGEERLYVATTGFTGQVLYHDGDGFETTSTVGLHAAFSDLREGQADLGYRSLVCFKGRLWTSPAASMQDADGSLHPVVLMNPAPADGAAWQTVVDTRTHPELGDPDNGGIFQMAAIGDDLYLSVGNRSTGFELWKGDGSACFAPPGTCAMTWSKIIDDGGGRPDDGSDPVVDNAGATLGVFRGQLYVAPAESGYFDLTLAEMMRVREDGTWELLVGWPRRDYAGIANMHCPAPVDLPTDGDADADDCYPTSLKGPGLGSNPYSQGTVSYFWRFVEHDDALFLGTLELTDGDGFDLYRSDDGVDWDVISKDGFGNDANYGIRTFASVPELGLVVGTANPYTDLPGGAEIWVGTTAPGEEIPPRAVAGDDELVFDEDQDGLATIMLNGADSVDPLGGSGIVFYEWFEGTLEDLGGSCEEIAAEPVFTEASPHVELVSFDPDTGQDILSYSFTLRVEDAAGNRACDEITVTASRNLPPSALLTASVPFAPPPETSATPDVRLADFDGDGVESYGLEALCTDFEASVASCVWWLRDPGNVLSDPSGCYDTENCELSTSVTSVVPGHPLLLETGIDRPDLFLLVQDAAGHSDYFRIESRVQPVVDTEGRNDPPVCRSSTFTMVQGLDETLFIDPTGEPRLCKDPDADDSEVTYELRVDSSYPEARHGTATASETLTYTPEPGYLGADTFYFRAINPGAGAGEETLSVTVGVRVRVAEELEAPEASVTFPLPEARLTRTEFRSGCDDSSQDVCGIASDDASGVVRVLVSLRDEDDRYWNGEEFASIEPIAHVAQGAENWSYRFAPPREGEYTLTAVAVDRVGKESETAESSFVVEGGDFEPPVVRVGFPEAGATYGPLLFMSGCGTRSLDVCGTAFDEDSGVASVEVSVLRDADGAYWSGTQFLRSSEDLFSEAAGTESWSYPAGRLPAGDYRLLVKAIDLEGNELEPVEIRFRKESLLRFLRVLRGDGEGRRGQVGSRRIQSLKR